MADGNPDGTVTDAERKTASLLGLLDSDESNQDEAEEEILEADEDFESEDDIELEADSDESDEAVEDDQAEDTNESEPTEGELRLADYTRKTQELARERQAMEAEFQAVQQERALYAEHLARLAEATKPQRPDFEAISREHGFEQAMAARMQYEAAMENYQAVEGERHATLQRMQQQAQKAKQEWHEQELRLLFDARPDWKDQDAYRKDATEIEEFAIGFGYTPDQLAEVSHRDILVLDAARKWFAAEAKAKSIKPKQGKVARPGTKGQMRRKGRAQKANERYAKTGSVEDGARVLGHILGG